MVNQERWAEINAACCARLEANPGDAAALHELGKLAREMGESEDAITLLQQSLQADSDNAAAIIELADILHEMGRAEEAVDFYRAALENAPRDPELHLKLGNALGAAGNREDGLKCLNKAVKLAPQAAATHANLGVAQEKLGDLAAAIASFRQARRLAPDDRQIMANLGGCLVQAGRFEEAITLLGKGVAKHPDSVGAFSNLAAAYNAFGDSAKAADAAWKALRLDPKSANALNNLGVALKDQGKYEQALNCFAQARDIQPRSHLAYANLGSTLSEMGRTIEAAEALRLALILKPNSPALFSNYLLTLNYQLDVSREAMFAEHQRFDKLFAEPLKAHHELHKNEPDPQRRLRVGYVSADFRDHPVAQFVEPMLRTHDAAQLEIFCYANQTINDAVTQRLRGYVPHWKNVVAFNDDQFAAQIQRDKIDILVDLSGHTAGNRLLTFALKPAPVQVSMIGYLQTTGLSAMDYRITDAAIDPVGESDAFSSEKLLRFANGAATFSPPVHAPAVNETPALTAGHITFASFNNLSKVTPAVLCTWADLLLTEPTARLLIVGREGGGLQEQLAEKGIEVSRLEIIPRLPMAEYLALHHRVDLVLDTFPYNGGTTSLLAAWMGVPFITLTSDSPVGRTGASLLSALELPQLIAASPADYVQRARAATADLEQLAAWRRALRPKLAALLADGSAFTRELEAAFRTIWKKWCAPRS